MPCNKYKWNQLEVDILTKWWPHFGTYGIEKILSIKRSRIKSKVNYLKLKILPKNMRLCVVCRKNYQYKRYAGLRCRECHLQQRKNLKFLRPNATLESWIRLATNTIVHRSNGLSDIDFSYMKNLWEKQNGLCYYSNIKMVQPIAGKPRNAATASIDRIDSSKTYIKDNVVWCCWACNMGKGSMTQKEYFDVCRMVVHKNIDRYG